MSTLFMPSICQAIVSATRLKAFETLTNLLSSRWSSWSASSRWVSFFFFPFVRYRVGLYGEWIDVPDDALITEPNRAGRTMVWPMLFNGEISVGCFMPGSMT
jgi:hypothetical protein